MISMLLKVESPRTGWCHEVGTAHPGTSIRVVQCFPLDRGVIQETVLLSGNGWAEALRAIQRHPTVERSEVLETTSSSARVRLQVTGCPFPRIFRATRVVPEMPFDLDRGDDKWLLVAPEGEATGLLEGIRATGLRVDVLRSGPYEPEQTLTPRQREVLDAAVEAGYYSYPRRTTLTQLATKLGIAKSTLSEMLMHVEERLLGGRHGGGPREMPRPAPGAGSHGPNGHASNGRGTVPPFVRPAEERASPPSNDPAGTPPAN